MFVYCGNSKSITQTLAIDLTELNTNNEVFLFRFFKNLFKMLIKLQKINSSKINKLKFEKE